jgi:hypothetical protein
LISQRGHAADQAGLALPALTEQNHVVTCQEGPLDLGQHGVVETDDARKAWLAAAHPIEEILSNLGLDRAVPMTAGTKRPEGGGLGAGKGRSRDHRCRHDPTVRPNGW